MNSERITQSPQQGTSTALASYPAYRNSRVDWLGEVPEHWSLIPNRYIFRQRKVQVGKNHGAFELLSLTLNGIIKRDMENPEGKFPAEFNTYQEVREGDFVFCLFDVEETPRTVGLSPFHGMITGAYTVFETNSEFANGYLYYFYLNLDKDKRLKHLYKGLRNTIPKENFYSFKTTIPPLPEQKAIAHFLDQKCARIDKAIAQKQRMIELLRERRQIMIQQAVTRGLDPNVPMKDSGIDWIGEIPVHWAVKRLKFLVDKKISNVDKHSKKFELEVELCNYTDVYKNEYITEELDFMVATASDVQIDKFKLKIGDVIITKDSEEWSDIAQPALVRHETENLICGYHLALFRPEDEIIGDYLFRVLECDAINLQFSLNANGVTRVGLSHADIGNPLLPVPPRSEQLLIAELLEVDSKNIADSIASIELSIDKLQEYRSVLIDSVVRGKVRVPENHN